MADWSSYLAHFHDERAGVTEEVMARSVAGQRNPYRWLARAVSSSATTVLDLACGSGALGRELACPGRTVIGVDLAAAELLRARESGLDNLALADARALPLADGSVDAVVSTLGLAVIEPTGLLLDEVSRVLRPGGLFVGLVPTIRPLGTADLRTAGQLTAILRTTPQFPAQVELRVGRLLAEHGLRKGEDARERYHFTVRTREDAWLLLHSFYLPQIEPGRLERAADWLEEQASQADGVQVPIPLRRIVAIK